MKILVVDDSATMRRIICNILVMLGFSSVSVAVNGKSAMEELYLHEYSLVISDWRMEPISGLDLLRWIRRDKKLNQLPFIMISAESDRNSIIETVKSGVSDYIVKPFSKATLKNKLQNIFGDF
ncbi:response regulator [Magnetospirillum sp. XM-1]|uniref:response regulator n=1 Tax=Magnetospirillum sp. XM-1 TaxID=1663591 RepID=UPI0018D279E2|nr:response regulator [Magnetospirillum sp. XM-1]